MNNNKKKTLAYVDAADPRDKRSWSGIPYNLVEQLKRHYDVEVIYLPDSPLVKLWCKAHKALTRLIGRHDDPRFSTLYAKIKGRAVTKALARGHYDALFVRGSNLAAYMKTDIPQRVYFSDACFHQMVDYYFYDMNPSCVRMGNTVQKRAMDNCTNNVFASQWAMKDAVEFYGIPQEKCSLGYFGASVDTTNFKKEAHDSRIVNLLFVGVEWVRKGGEIAVDCVKYLNETDKEHEYTLHFVGCTPPYEIKDEHVKLYGFLNRNIPEQAQQMIHLREIADFFVLPTRAECAGIVFCESSAYGIPSITYDTGGIGDYVINGENGYRLPMTAKGKEFAEKIKEIMQQPEKLAYMKTTAEKMYRERLNWDALGDTFHKVIG